MPSQKVLDKLYIDIAFRIARESKAVRRKVGAIIVKNNAIRSYGYNGTPTGEDNCCEYEEKEALVTKPNVIHAEINSVYKAYNSGVKGATMYITDAPCINCATQIGQINAMMSENVIDEVIYARLYKSDEGAQYLISKGVKVRKVEISVFKEHVDENERVIS